MVVASVVVVVCAALSAHSASAAAPASSPVLSRVLRVPISSYAELLRHSRAGCGVHDDDDDDDDDVELCYYDADGDRVTLRSQLDVDELLSSASSTHAALAPTVFATAVRAASDARAGRAATPAAGAPAPACVPPLQHDALSKRVTQLESVVFALRARLEATQQQLGREIATNASLRPLAEHMQRVMALVNTPSSIDAVVSVARAVASCTAARDAGDGSAVDSDDGGSNSSGGGSSGSSSKCGFLGSDLGATTTVSSAGGAASAASADDDFVLVSAAEVTSSAAAQQSSTSAPAAAAVDMVRPDAPALCVVVHGASGSASSVPCGAAASQWPTLAALHTGAGRLVYTDGEGDRVSVAREDDLREALAWALASGQRELHLFAAQAS